MNARPRQSSLALAVIFLFGVRGLGAQVGVMVSGGATAARARALTGTGAVQGHGVALDAAATVTYGRALLEIGYAEGTLTPSDAETLQKRLIDGRVALGLRLPAGLPVSVLAGLRARAYEAPGGLDHWAWWEVRACAGAPLVGTTLRGDIGIWYAVSLDMNIPQGAGRGRGGEVGLLFRPPGRPWEFRLAYVVDQLAVPGAERRDMLDGVRLSTGFAIR